MFRLQLVCPNFQTATALGLLARPLKLQVWKISVSVVVPLVCANFMWLSSCKLPSFVFIDLEPAAKKKNTN